MIVGIDGGSPEVIETLVARGELPVLQSLISRGRWGLLASTVPPLTPPAWTSFMTGVNPGKHGLFHFIEPRKDSYSFQYVNAKRRRYPTIWRLLHERGLSTGVLNVPMTWPVEELNGYMISGLDAPDTSSACIHPAPLANSLKRDFSGWPLEIRHLEYMRSPRRRRQVLAEFAELERHRTEIAAQLIRYNPVDVFMLVYCSVDQIQHYFWHYADEKHPAHDPAAPREFREAIADGYRRIDTHIGQLLSAAAGEEPTVFIMSDHGAGAMSPQTLHLNDMLADAGFLSFREGKHSTDGTSAVIPQLDRILRRMLPPSLKHLIAARFSSLQRAWETSLSGLERIDWSRTRAFAFEIVPSATAFFLNRKGTFPQGIIVTDAEADRTIDELVEYFHGLTHPDSGEKLVKGVFRRHELYHGPDTESSPDVLLSWWQENGFTVRPSTASVDAPRRQTYTPGGDSLLNWTGTHRLDGIFCASGGAVVHSSARERLSIMDLAPTILALCECPIPAWMDGQAASGLFPDGYLNVALAGDGDFSDGHGAHDRPGTTPSDTEQTEMQRRLRALGYLS